MCAHVSSGPKMQLGGFDNGWQCLPSCETATNQEGLSKVYLDPFIGIRIQDSDKS